MKIPQKYAPLIFGVMMSAIMSLVMSFAMTAINVGLHPQFLALWFKGFATGFIVATPVSFGAVRVADRVVKWLTGGPLARSGIGR
jgi:hypothetical protein